MPPPPGGPAPRESAWPGPSTCSWANGPRACKRSSSAPSRNRGLPSPSLKALQVADFEGLLEAMDGLPVVVRLLDPPLHEFLPSRMEIEQEMYRRVPLLENIADLQTMSAQVEQWEEVNPMMGLRGVRLGLIRPELYRMQVEAALEAVVRRLRAGGDPQFEIMIPLVADAEELRRMRTMIEEHIKQYSAGERA